MHRSPGAMFCCGARIQAGCGGKEKRKALATRTNEPARPPQPRLSKREARNKRLLSRHPPGEGVSPERPTFSVSRVVCAACVRAGGGSIMLYTA